MERKFKAAALIIALALTSKTTWAESDNTPQKAPSYSVSRQQGNTDKISFRIKTSDISTPSSWFPLKSDITIDVRSWLIDVSYPLKSGDLCRKIVNVSINNTPYDLLFCGSAEATRAFDSVIQILRHASYKEDPNRQLLDRANNVLISLQINRSRMGCILVDQNGTPHHSYAATPSQIVGVREALLVTLHNEEISMSDGPAF